MPARPECIAVAVNRIVVSDLFSSSNISQTYNEPLSFDSPGVSVRLTRVVDVPLRRLHQHDSTLFEIVAMAAFLPGLERVLRVRDARIVDRQDRLARTKRGVAKHSDALDGDGRISTSAGTLSKLGCE
jgi:hypothetical protein